MKTLIAAFIGAAALLQGSQVLAAADPGVDQEALVRICEAVRKNDVMEMRREVAEFYGIGIPKHQGLRLMARDLRCNGMTPVDYALRNDARDVASTLAERSGRERAESRARAVAQKRAATAAEG